MRYNYIRNTYASWTQQEKTMEVTFKFIGKEYPKKSNMMIRHVNAEIEADIFDKNEYFL